MSDICSEKISNYREYMLINGLSKGGYYGSHLFMAYKSAISSGIMGAVGLYYVYYDHFVPGTSIWPIIGSYILAGISVSHFSLMLTSLLSAKNATDIGGFGNLLSGLLFLFVLKFDNIYFYYGSTIFPVCALNATVLP